MVALSVLDLSPVTTGGSGAAALHNSIDLARLADKLGYTRYWVAEHHNLPSVASSAPDIMIGQIAAATERMRVGSGGIMLPNHAPLSVLERFHVLEALFPGRIDLGIGRAPGTDQITSHLLRRRQDIRDEDDFIERFKEMVLLESRAFPADHPYHNIRAMPADVELPPIYLLGSSGYSAELAARIGAGFSFAHHFSDYDPVRAMTTYRELFQPSVTLQKPHAILGIAAVAADTDAEADRLATTIDLNYVRRQKGEYLPLESPEAAAAHPYTAVDKERIAYNRRRVLTGSAETVRARLDPLIAATKADEVMITTMIYDHGARRHSYEVLAQAFGLSGAAAPAQAPPAPGTLEAKSAPGRPGEA
ncbi:MAG: LLM class flavin-dependent oxidoreductase [Bradyrhizobiaceae bacterium]|nr:LLM class flavin-dependent oxidoreductase [Bradyrhizobiaceae bacterium]